MLQLQSKLRLSLCSAEPAQTFNKQDGRALDRPCFVLSYAGITATVFTVKIGDFQKSNVLEKRAFVFVVGLNLFVVLVPVDGDGQGTRNQTLQVSKRGFDAFRLLQLSCERWWNYLI